MKRLAQLAAATATAATAATAASAAPAAPAVPAVPAASAAAATPAAGFSADWLQRREPFDAAARAATAPQLKLRQRLMAWRPSGSAPLRVIDLACGTGANLRWLAPQLGGRQQWLVVDHDAALLRRWPAALEAAKSDAADLIGAEPDGAESGAAAPIAAALKTSVLQTGERTGRACLQFAGAGFCADVVRRRLDLAVALESLPWHAAHLATASALLDLVSAAWLQRLVAAATAARVAVLMALSVDGRHHFAPSDAGDGDIGMMFRAHQQRDKGFVGPALGAAAGAELVLALRRAGYRVYTARSDWRLDGRRDAQALALQRALIDGMAAAAAEQRPDTAAAVEAWRQLRQLLAPRSSLRVGHLDVLALPPR